MIDEIARNIERCDKILARLMRMSDSDGNQANTWLLIGEIENKIIELKMLYGQIMP